MRSRADAEVDGVRVHAFEVPTDGPGGGEEDGTLRWDSTTLVLVEAHAGGRTGLGYTYGDVTVAAFVESALAPAVRGADALAPPAPWERMFAAIRNAGRPGAGAMAVSAVDVALWDLRARLLGLPLFRVLPAFHDRVPVYGSGRFTNYPLDRLAAQLAGWVEQGIPRVKVKVSRRPDEDPRRLTAVRDAIGDRAELFADANGALTRKDALYWARRFRRAADRPVGAPRHGGVSAHAFCAVDRLRHLEYFHDHVRVEHLVFDGTLTPADGAPVPDPGRPGLGLEVRWSDAEPYRIHGSR